MAFRYSPFEMELVGPSSTSAAIAASNAARASPNQILASLGFTGSSVANFSSADRHISLAIRSNASSFVKSIIVPVTYLRVISSLRFPAGAE